MECRIEKALICRQLTLSQCTLRIRMKRNASVIEQLQITAFANEGKTIGHHQGKVVFVKGAIPGELVNAVVTRSKKDWMEAEVTTVLKPSPLRVQPFCMHYGKCGGCQWQHLNYQAQLQSKEWLVFDTLERMGKVRIQTREPIVGCDQEKEYRNKLEFTFTSREWLAPEAFYLAERPTPKPALGFHLPGAFDRVFDVVSCALQPDLSDRIRIAVKSFTLEQGYEYFHLRHQSGMLRNLMIRMTTTGEVMVLVVFAHAADDRIALLMNFLKVSFPEITSLQYVINVKQNDTIYDLEVITYSGQDAIYELIDDLKFKISAKSFFQTNSAQAARLYSCVKEYAGLTGSEIVYDLYTGTGSIALYLARSCNKIVGIEQVPQAIEDAYENAAVNGISNAAFYVADIVKIFDQSFHALHGLPQVVITDPPRAGMHPDVVKELLQMAPERIVYVSCNVTTQARDLQLLSTHYIVSRVRPFDLFPQTRHVENVALLERIS